MLRMAAALYTFRVIGAIVDPGNGGRDYVWALVTGLALLGFPFSYSIWKSQDKTISPRRRFWAARCPAWGRILVVAISNTSVWAFARKVAPEIRWFLPPP